MARPGRDFISRPQADDTHRATSTGVLSVDPGTYGGCVSGSSLEDVEVIPYPVSSEDCKAFCRKYFKIGYAFAYEKRPITDKIPGGAKRIYRMGFDDGMWHVISSSFHQKIGWYPQSWRRIAFPTLKIKPKGGMQWKKVEYEYTKFLTGEKLIQGDKFWKSDRKEYGISAAFCIWIAGMKSEGLINIEEEVKRRK